GLGFVCGENQRYEILFFLRNLFLFVLFAEIWVDADVVLALVLAEIEDFKGAIVSACLLELALNSDEALARCMYRELPEVGSDPLTAEFFGDGRRGAGAAEEIGNDVILVGGDTDDAI